MPPLSHLIQGIEGKENIFRASTSVRVPTTGIIILRYSIVLVNQMSCLSSNEFQPLRITEEVDFIDIEFTIFSARLLYFIIFPYFHRTLCLSVWQCLNRTRNEKSSWEI